jgi:hypothetical protein
MDNWSRGWRKLVEWDKENKVYIYKGFRIIPLSYQQQIEMPTHLQNSYYFGEIEHINRVVEDRQKPHKTVEEAQAEMEKAMDIFWESVGL